MKYRDKNGILHDFDVIQGMSAYQSAKIGGYDKTEEEFYREISDLATNKKVEEVKEEIQGEVGLLAEEIADIRESKMRGWEVGDNRIDNDTWVNGYLTATGTLGGTDGTYRTTDYIDVSDGEGKTVYFMQKRGGILDRPMWIGLYDGNKQWIERQKGVTSVEITSNVKYIRISDDGEGKNYNLLSMAIVSDEKPTVTDYIPYVSPNEIIVTLKSNVFAKNTIPTNALEGNLEFSNIYKVGRNQKYHNIKDAIEDAVKYRNSVVYVEKGVYDLVEEFGQSYLDGYSLNASFGIDLKNGVHVIFEQGAKVMFDYQGTNTQIHEYFSPFRASQTEQGDFTIDNLNLVSKNCRYAIHDEGATNPYPYIHTYKNCVISHDSSNCSWGAHQAIGGGLGINAIIDISNCVISTVGTVESVTYHNSSSEDAESQAFIKDSYLSGTFKITNFGTSTKKTKAYISNCSCSAVPESINYPQYAENVELYSWNNEIRS